MIGWLKIAWGAWQSWKTGKPWNDARRSPLWPAARREHLRREPFCQWCGERAFLQCHHILPFHVYPYFELFPANLITLCEPPGPGGCHLARGHLGDWRLWNPRIRLECEAGQLGALRKANGVYMPDAVPPPPTTIVPPGCAPED